MDTATAGLGYLKLTLGDSFHKLLRSLGHYEFDMLGICEIAWSERDEFRSGNSKRSIVILLYDICTEMFERVEFPDIEDFIDKYAVENMHWYQIEGDIYHEKIDTYLDPAFNIHKKRETILKNISRHIKKITCNIINPASTFFDKLNIVEHELIQKMPIIYIKKLHISEGACFLTIRNNYYEEYIDLTFEIMRDMIEEAPFIFQSLVPKKYPEDMSNLFTSEEMLVNAIYNAAFKGELYRADGAIDQTLASRINMLSDVRLSMGVPQLKRELTPRHADVVAVAVAKLTEHIRELTHDKITPVVNLHLIVENVNIILATVSGSVIAYTPKSETVNALLSFQNEIMQPLIIKYRCGEYLIPTINPDLAPISLEILRMMIKIIDASPGRTDSLATKIIAEIAKRTRSS